MQKAMHGQMTEMVLERLVFGVGFAARGLIGDGDVAQHARRIVAVGRAFGLQRWKREHVGRLVDAAPVLVERADARVVGQHDREFGVRSVGVHHGGGSFDGAVNRGFRIGFLVPAFGCDKDFGRGDIGGRHGLVLRVVIVRSGVIDGAGQALPRPGCLASPS